MTPKLKGEKRKNLEIRESACSRDKNEGEKEGPFLFLFSWQSILRYRIDGEKKRRRAKMHFIHRWRRKVWLQWQKRALAKKGFLSWRRGLIEKSFPDSPQFPLKREAARLKKKLSKELNDFSKDFLKIYSGSGSSILLVYSAF